MSSKRNRPRTDERRDQPPDAARYYPQIVDAEKRRNWAWLAHGKTNSLLHADMAPAEERALLEDIIGTIKHATGQSPKGWFGPGLTETFETPGLLKDLGLSYVLDWCADDQPFPLRVPGMISVPYSVELNDINLFLSRSISGVAFYHAVVDQFDQLYDDSAQSGRVMAFALHSFVVGQPFRARYLAKALEYIASHEGVWFATSDEIAEQYLSTVATG